MADLPAAPRRTRRSLWPLVLVGLLGLFFGALLGALCTAGAGVLVAASWLTAPAAAAPPAVQGRADVTLVMSEQYLNNRVRDDLKTRQMPIPIQELYLDVKPENRIIAQFKINVPILGPQTITLPFLLESAGGQVRVRAVETPLGQLQVSFNLGEVITQEINLRVSRAGESLLYDVVSLQTSEDTIAIGLHARE